MTKNINERLKEHNEGETSSNRSYRPFEVIFTKGFPNSFLARNYENFLKIRSNKEELIRKLSLNAGVAELVDAQA